MSNVKNTVKKNNVKNNNVEKTMKEAEVKVEVKREKKARKTFKDHILERIDVRSKNVSSDAYQTIRFNIEKLLIELEEIIDREGKKKRAEKIAFRKLSKFSRTDIENYLKSL